MVLRVRAAVNGRNKITLCHLHLMALKSQSAMEYLMTYGWAVLAIAIVIIALFQLGVFGGNNLTPHSTSGACQAVHTAAGSSLAGQCNSAQPKFVAQFNGQNSYISIPSSAFNYPTSGSTNNFALTFSVWFATTSNGVILGQDSGVLPPSSPSGYVPAIYLDTNGLVRASIFWHGGTQDQIVSANSYNNGAWHSIIDTYDNGIETLYIDGQKIGSQSISENGYSATYDYFLGTGFGTSWPNFGSGWLYFGSGLSNAQVYNTSLSQSEITSLYQEGIGGAPIDPAHIAGWWPLNGNAQDYSGDNNNGQAINVAYNGTWESSYVQP